MKRSFLLLLTAVLLAVLVAACGTSSTTSSSGSAAAGGSAGGAAGGPASRTKLAACLKAHGVTLPSPPSGVRRAPGASGGYGGSGRSGGGPGFFGGAPGAAGRRSGFRANPKFQAALKACGANFPRRRFNGAPQRAVIESFAACVRKHGFDLPKPNLSGHGAVFPAKIANNAKFRAASRSCVALLRRPSGAPTGGAPPST